CDRGGAPYDVDLRLGVHARAIHFLAGFRGLVLLPQLRGAFACADLVGDRLRRLWATASPLLRARARSGESFEYLFKRLPLSTARTRWNDNRRCHPRGAPRFDSLAHL